MKLTIKDKEYLLKIGYKESDFEQIEVATLVKNTKYEMDNKKIPLTQLLEIMNREEYINGVARSAFHGTATRYTKDGKVVYFDSSNLFK